MMRALWTSSSGMKSQQFNVDVISNNLSNVNTTGYKKERAEFKDMLYETLTRADLLDGEGRPVNLQVGHGTVPAATSKNFQMGNLEKTENPLDFAIDGDGFFTVAGRGEDVAYTRDGSFKISVTDFGNMITTSDGSPVLDENGMEIIIDVDISRLNVGTDGELSYTDEEGVVIPMGQRLGLVKFPNKYGLESIGSNNYTVTPASGQPVPDDQMGRRSSIRQNFLESSNVQVVEEMVKLITAQRAYEINSKAIQSADDMLGMANNLKR
ncbi:flagellar hook-basal body protein [Herbivorax sp. ANBcel31]|uniref:flagellar hook-basal body protein n=1 Tax=Herbivorax sp. ANBcel31 TaxID=3069754 RepID=UPI0027B526B9|nr:flagellar hook-basal body protein [Herbivorax sp. ANBcel31]MDQ2086514.1 flagellar hook-basal body protein [Herbivorax sp. ANBcel31]